MVNYEDNLTPLGRQMKAEREAMAAQANPAMMGVPQAGTGGGPQYKFNINDVLNYRDPQWQNSPAAGTQAPSDDAGRWFRIKGSDGQSLVVQRNYAPATWEGEGQQRQYTQGPLASYSVMTDPGDFGGGWLTDGPEAAKMNGRAYDSYDASGKYTGSSKISGWKDSGVMGPWGALAVLAMPFVAAGLGVGAAAGAGAGASAAAGGSLASEMAALGAGTATAAGGTGAATAAATAAAADAAAGGFSGWSLGGLGGEAAAQAAIDSGAGFLGDAAIGGAAGGAAAAGGGGQAATPAVFNPAVDSQLASTQLGITGSQAAADAAAAAIPSVTVNGAPTGSWLSNLTASGGLVPGTGDVGGGTLGSLSSAASSLGSGSSSLIPGISNGQLLGAAGSVIGGALGSNAASTAAEQQLQSTRESNALLERMFNKQIDLQEPFRQNGLAAGNRMMTLLGTGGDTGSADYGSFNKPFTAESLYADPSYQFRKDEGAKAVTHGYAGKGNFLSGAGAKALDRYGQDYASTEYGNAWNRDQTSKTNQFNRYASVYGSGQTAANTQGNAAGTYGQNASQNIQAGGNALAAGTVGSANAWSNTLNGIWNNYSQNELMNQLLRK